MKRKHIRFYFSLGLMLIGVALAAALPPLQAQQILTFPPVPCDSTLCDSLVVHNSTPGEKQLVALIFRDGISYQIAPSLLLPAVVAEGDSIGVPVCFTPSRRGVITDSLAVIMASSSGGSDTIKFRVTGQGIGPALDAVPNVLNFPRTNPPNTSVLVMTIRNNGELPFVLTAAALNIPAPFRLVTTLPRTIMPGDTLQIGVIFEPQEEGVYSSPVDLIAGCSTRLQLGFNGVTDLIGTGAVLRISKTGFNPLNNEQIPCDSLRCTNVTFSNVGNAPLIIESINWLLGTLGYTITTSAPTPFIIAPNGQRELEVCLSSRQRGTLRDTLVVKSNTRTSIAFGLVIDVSGSMRAPMQCGNIRSTRMEQAKNQAKTFIGRTLLHLPAIGIQDQLAILTYTSADLGFTNIIDVIFPLAFITATSRGTAQNTINGLTEQGGTPTGAALRRMIDILAASPLQNRVIILLTDGLADGADQRNNPVDQIAALANSRGIRVFTIGVGLNSTGNAYLRTLSTGTNGASFDASDNDCSTLQSAFEAITDIVSRGTITTEPFAMKVLSPFLVTTKSMKFDSVHVNATICDTLTITNVGEGNAVIDSIKFLDLLDQFTDEFKLAPTVTFPIPVPESGQIQVVVCFNPSRIRVRDGKAFIYYNSCGSQPTPMDLSGPSYAYANLRVSDLRIGLPGDVVTMPIHYDTSLAAYSVNSISYEVRWNKTMLDLRGVRPGGEAGGGNVTITTPVTYDDKYARVGITATGTNLPGNGELAQLDFQVLRGDSLGSLVELTTGLFEDDNPRTRISNAGVIAFDSTCFRPFKPIDNNGAAKIVAGEVFPVPAREQAVTLPISSDIVTSVSLEVYTTDGRLVIPAADRTVLPGAGSIEIDMSGIPSGSYYALVKTESGETIVRKILLAR